MKLKIKNEKLKILEKNFGLFIILLLGLIPLLDLLHPGLPLTHDGQDHVARIANFYSSLSEGNIVPRWAENLNWGFGHPILMFLYPFPSYLTSFIHFFGFNFVDSVKIVFGITYVLSGITMYLWVKEFLNEKAAIIAGLFYMFAPYRFVDFYVRGAIGEHVAFLFIPLTLYFVLKASKNYSYVFFIFSSISLAGLLLSHNAISIMFLPFLLFYIVFLSMQEKKKTKKFFVQYVFILLVGFSLAAFFILPAFLEGKYTLRDIVTNHQEYATSFVTPLQFLFGDWNYGGTLFFTKQIGIIQIIATVLSLFLVFKSKEKKQKILYCVIFIYFVGALFIMMKQSQFLWQLLSILQKFQFPWRFLTIVVFATSVMAAFAIFWTKNKQISKVILVLSIAGLFLYTPFWHPQGYLYKSESFYTGIYNSTTDTGESAPIWSVRFMEKRPQDTMEVIIGDATIKKEYRLSTKHVYSVNAKKETRLKDNTVYFPGWKVLVDNRETEIQYQDPLQRGLITFTIPEGIHSVVVVFTNTKIRLISNSISLLTLIGICFFPFIKKALLKSRG